MIYLHIGDGISIPLQAIIAIYDYKIFTEGKNQLPGISCYKADNSNKKIKSVIQADSGIYFSAISSQTLFNRSQQLL